MFIFTDVVAVLLMDDFPCASQESYRIFSPGSAFSPSPRGIASLSCLPTMGSSHTGTIQTSAYFQHSEVTQVFFEEKDSLISVWDTALPVSPINPNRKYVLIFLCLQLSQGNDFYGNEAESCDNNQRWSVST